MAGTAENSLLLLGIDTCGPSGSVALGRISVPPGLEGRCSNGASVEILGQIEIDGRSYSERLVAVVGELLVAHGVRLRQVGAIVAVNGPGSFTGVRLGLSAVKGLAGGAGMPVVAVSRLEVLAGKAGLAVAALDAHRNEVFLRVGGRELLAGAEELAEIEGPVVALGPVAVCDATAAKLLGEAWAELVQVEAPKAADALKLASPRVAAKEFVELALLDGNYLRRPDAEIAAEIHSGGAAGENAEAAAARKG
jgi:tRNA threonylcarbamoyladenosine biosynthesis protein TsaB